MQLTLLNVFVFSCVGVLLFTVLGYSKLPAWSSFWEALYYYVAFSTLAAPFAIGYMFHLTQDKLVWLLLIFPLFNVVLGFLFAGMS